VTLGNGLEEIGGYAFQQCTTLEGIVIPPAVKAIKERAFCDCTGLPTVTHGDRLEEIWKNSFNKRTSLERNVIPPIAKFIDHTAFNNCSTLTSVKFCDEIEEFVTCEGMRDWWNQGVHEKSLSTYRFLVNFNISERLGLVRVRSW